MKSKNKKRIIVGSIFLGLITAGIFGFMMFSGIFSINDDDGQYDDPFPDYNIADSFLDYPISLNVKKGVLLDGNISSISNESTSIEVAGSSLDIRFGFNVSQFGEKYITQGEDINYTYQEYLREVFISLSWEFECMCNLDVNISSMDHTNSIEGNWKRIKTDTTVFYEEYLYNSSAIRITGEFNEVKTIHISSCKYIDLFSSNSLKDHIKTHINTNTIYSSDDIYRNKSSSYLNSTDQLTIRNENINSAGKYNITMRLDDMGNYSISTMLSALFTYEYELIYDSDSYLNLTIYNHSSSNWMKEEISNPSGSGIQNVLIKWNISDPSDVILKQESSYFWTFRITLNGSSTFIIDNFNSDIPLNGDIAHRSLPFPNATLDNMIWNTDSNIESITLNLSDSFGNTLMNQSVNGSFYYMLGLELIEGYNSSYYDSCNFSYGIDCGKWVFTKKFNGSNSPSGYALFEFDFYSTVTQRNLTTILIVERRY